MERPRRMLFWRTDGEHAENSTAERSTTRNRSRLGEMQRERREGKEVGLCFPPLLLDLAAPSKKGSPFELLRTQNDRCTLGHGAFVLRPLCVPRCATAARAYYSSFKLVCRPV